MDSENYSGAIIVVAFFVFLIFMGMQKSEDDRYDQCIEAQNEWIDGDCVRDKP